MDAMKDYSLGTSLAEKYEILKFHFFVGRNAVSICSKKRHMSMIKMHKRMLGLGFGAIVMFCCIVSVS